jgi:regulator of sigma E protease
VLALQSLTTLAAFLLTLGILVSFHEYGHFLAARFCGVKVLRFSIGFGKPLFTYRAQSGTEWVVAGIPLGGYVKLLDGRDSSQKMNAEDRQNAFEVKPLWQRSFIVAAGPLANFVLAILLLATLYSCGVPQLAARIQAPPAQSLAAKSGLLAGDQIVGWKSAAGSLNESGDLDGFDEILSWNSLRWRLMDALTAERGFILQLQSPEGGQFTKLFPGDILPKMEANSDPMLALGILPLVSATPDMFELKLDPLDAVGYAMDRVYLITKVSLRMMLGLFTGKTALNQLGGPLSIADMAGKTAQVGWQPYIGFLALMSISIGLLNLLPFPMLDGGQLLYDAWELVAGKRISISMQEKLQKLGFLLLVAFSLLALFNDLKRYLIP